MTYLEAALDKYPGMNADSIVRGMCPDELELDGTDMCANPNSSSLETCKLCWNREMPE